MYYVASNSGVQQVQSGSNKQPLIAPLQTISKNGYLFVYVSNESPQDVYFDDITVKHYTGPLLQEQSYYPFGVEMAAISDKAMNKLSSAYKFNGGDEMEESISMYSTFYRGYDQQLGRFMGVDMASEQTSGMSVYQFGTNNPLMFNDPLGDKLKDPSERLDLGPLGPYNPFAQAEAALAESQARSEAWFKYITEGGGGIYAQNMAYWNNVWNSIPKDANGYFRDDNAGTLFEYTNTSGSGIFVTTDNHGESYYEGYLKEDYHLTNIYGELPSFDVSNADGESKGDGRWLETTHHVIHWSEVFFTAGEVSNASRTFGEFGGGAYWVGNNLQVVSNTLRPNFYGNQFTGSRQVMSEFAEGMGKIAKPLGVLSAGISIGQAVYDVTQGHYEAAGVHTLDAVMGVVGTFGGPVGWAVSGAYFVSRFWWGNNDD
jgi:RHS repeat-associated protein